MLVKADAEIQKLILLAGRLAHGGSEDPTRSAAIRRANRIVLSAVADVDDVTPRPSLCDIERLAGNRHPTFDITPPLPNHEQAAVAHYASRRKSTQLFSEQQSKLAEAECARIRCTLNERLSSCIIQLTLLIPRCRRRWALKHRGFRDS